MKAQVDMADGKKPARELKILFIGGTGIISSACSALALEQGMQLYLLTRGKSIRPISRGAIALQGDIRQPATLSATINDLTFDAVVEWVAFTPSR